MKQFAFLMAAIVLLVYTSPNALAQRLSGEYVVIDSAVVGRVDDPSVTATRTFRFNDTVRAVRRVDSMILVKYLDLVYRLPFSSVVRVKEFNRYRKSVAVVSDSAEVRTAQSTIWVRQGAVLYFLGDDVAGRIRVQIYGQMATMLAADVIWNAPCWHSRWPYLREFNLSTLCILKPWNSAEEQ